jgi:GrpB-like predicted nucleotidyltransferase (UPF0157 family)
MFMAMGAPREPANSLDEPIHISDWNSSWPRQARALIAELEVALGGERAIEHVGSTAIDGMQAKPVVDLMIGSVDEAEQDIFAQRLSEIGWHDMGEAGVPGRRHLLRRSGEHVNVHIVLFGSAHWVNNLDIREYLRAHAEERAAYASVKHASIASEADRLLAYSERKSAFMNGLLERARNWRKVDRNDR